MTASNTPQSDDEFLDKLFDKYYRERYHTIEESENEGRKQIAAHYAAKLELAELKGRRDELKDIHYNWQHSFTTPPLRDLNRRVSEIEALIAEKEKS
jgi:phytoene/squalene synthetase